MLGLSSNIITILLFCILTTPCVLLVTSNTFNLKILAFKKRHYRLVKGFFHSQVNIRVKLWLQLVETQHDWYTFYWSQHKEPSVGLAMMSSVFSPEQTNILCVRLVVCLFIFILNYKETKQSLSKTSMCTYLSTDTWKVYLSHWQCRLIVLSVLYN